MRPSSTQAEQAGRSRGRSSCHAKWLGLFAALAASFGMALAPAAEAASERRAQQILRFCGQCHGADGGGNELFLAPAIAGLPGWYVETQLRNFRSGQRGMHHEDIPGLRMYPMSQTLRDDADLEAISALVGTLPPAPPEPTLAGGDPKRGESLYTICATCHGPAAAGNELLSAPPLRYQADWYLVSSLERYKARVRGGPGSAALAQAMVGMAATLPDDQAILDVVAYILSLRDVDPEASQPASGAATGDGG